MVILRPGTNFDFKTAGLKWHKDARELLPEIRTDTRCSSQIRKNLCAQFSKFEFDDVFSFLDLVIKACGDCEVVVSELYPFFLFCMIKMSIDMLPSIEITEMVIKALKLMQIGCVNSLLSEILDVQLHFESPTIIGDMFFNDETIRIILECAPVFVRYIATTMNVEKHSYYIDKDEYNSSSEEEIDDKEKSKLPTSVGRCVVCNRNGPICQPCLRCGEDSGAFFDHVKDNDEDDNDYVDDNKDDNNLEDVNLKKRKNNSKNMNKNSNMNLFLFSRMGDESGTCSPDQIPDFLPPNDGDGKSMFLRLISKSFLDKDNDEDDNDNVDDNKDDNNLEDINLKKSKNNSKIDESETCSPDQIPDYNLPNDGDVKSWYDRLLSKSFL
jgi:hypothetical protein